MNDLVRTATIFFLVPSLFFMAGFTVQAFRNKRWRWGMLGIVLIVEVAQSGLVRYVGAGYGLGAVHANAWLVDSVLDLRFYLGVTLLLFVTLLICLIQSVVLWWERRRGDFLEGFRQ